LSNAFFQWFVLLLEVINRRHYTRSCIKRVTDVLAQFSVRVTDVLAFLGNLCLGIHHVTVERKGKHLIISPSKASSKLDQLEEHGDFIQGDPEEIVHMDWSAEWRHPL